MNTDDEQFFKEPGACIGQARKEHGLTRALCVLMDRLVKRSNMAKLLAATAWYAV